jgi:hypothetical protein
MCPGPGTCPGPPGNIGKHDVRASTDTHIISSAIIIHIFFMVYLLLALIFEIFRTSALMLTEDSGISVSCNRQVLQSFSCSQPFLLPVTRITMPPIIAIAPTIGGSGSVLVLSADMCTGPRSTTFSLVV